MKLEEFLQLNKEQTEFLCSYFDSDVGEMVDCIDDKGIYLMDITCDINHYHVLPISREEFIKGMLKRAKETIREEDAEYEIFKSIVAASGINI